LPFLHTAQNVGVGTTTPAEKLEIKNPLRSTVKISAGSLADTTQLVFSNTGSTAGFYTDFSIKSVREEGLFFSSKSDLGPNNSANSLVILPSGNIGMGISTPTSKLHVNGGIKIEGLNLLEFGVGVAGKEVNAGKIGYNGFGTSALTIVGAGTTSSNRAVYFFAEGGTTFSGPATVTGNVNVGGQLQMNGSPGTSGQVLRSNGASDPTWANAALSNNIRFAVTLGQDVSVFDDAVITTTRYNLNPADVVIGSNFITINRSGLYHFDVSAYGSVSFAATTAFIPDMYVSLFAGPATGLSLIKDRRMQSSNNSLSNSYSCGDNVSLEIYISAPANVRVSYGLNTLGIPGGSSSHSFSGFIAGHLISE